MKISYYKKVEVLDTQKIINKVLNKANKVLYQNYQYVTLYHGTLLDNVPNILKYGLIPTKNIFGSPAVFLTPTKESAQYHANKLKSKGAILQVLIPQDELKGKKLEILRKNPVSEIKLYKSIPPSNITFIEEIKPKKLYQRKK